MQRSGAAAALRSKAMLGYAAGSQGHCSMLCKLSTLDLRSIPREPGNFFSSATLRHRPSRPGEASGRLAAGRSSSAGFRFVPGRRVEPRPTSSPDTWAQESSYLAYSSVSKSVFENTATSSPSSSDTSPTDGSDAGSTVKRGGSAAARRFNSSKVGIRSPL